MSLLCRRVKGLLRGEGWMEKAFRSHPVYLRCVCKCRAPLSSRPYAGGPPSVCVPGGCTAHSIASKRLKADV